MGKNSSRSSSSKVKMGMGYGSMPMATKQMNRMMKGSSTPMPMKMGK